MKLIALILLLSFSAQAQFSFFKRGPNTSSVKVSYECNGKMVEKKIKFKSKDEGLSSKAESACPEKFMLALQKKITEAKGECSAEDKGTVCVSDVEALTKSVTLKVSKIESPKIESPKIAPKESHKIVSSLQVGSEAEAQKLFDSKIAEVISDPAKCVDLPTIQDSSRLNVMVRYPKVFASGIDKLQAAGSGCLNPLLGNYKSLLSQLSVENKPEVQDYCASNSESPACVKVKENLEQIDRNIRKLIASQRGKDAQSWLETGSCQNAPFKDYDDLGQRIKEYEKEMKCLPLKNNSERIVLDEGGKPIYRLKKDANGNIETALALNVTGPAVDGVTPQEMLERAQKCLNSASKFLAPPDVKGFTVKIMSPAEAKAQNVPVHDIGLTTSNTPKNQNIVSHSDEYRTDISCGIIAHEVMHLLGLPDEYRHDQSSGCFTPPPLPSLMGGKKSDDKNGNWGLNVPQIQECECQSEECKKVYSAADNDVKRFYSLASGYKLNNTANKMKCTETFSNELWSTVQNKSQLQKLEILKEESNLVQYNLRYLNGDKLQTTSVQCRCGADDSSCMAEMNKEVKSWKKSLAARDTAENCPAGFKKKFVFPNEGEGKPGSIVIGQNGFKYFTKTKHTGLLLPAQVALISSGHCPDVARKYRECFAWGSYSEGDELDFLPDYIREANANGIGQCRNNSNPGCVKISCQNRPAYCDDNSTYMNP